MNDATEAFPTRTLPVEQWVIRLESPVVDDGAALDGWLSLVRAQGWSPVGEAETVTNNLIAENLVNTYVMGRVVRYPGLTVSDDIRNAIQVPA